MGVAVIPYGANVYVVNGGEPAGYNSMGESYFATSTVSVINTTTNKVTTNVTVRPPHVAFGQFIGDKIQKAKLNGTKAKASLSKHKQKNHSKHHKTEKITKCKVDGNNWISISLKWK